MQFAVLFGAGLAWFGVACVDGAGVVVRLARSVDDVGHCLGIDDWERGLCEEGAESFDAPQKLGSVKAGLRVRVVVVSGALKRDAKVVQCDDNLCRGSHLIFSSPAGL